MTKEQAFFDGWTTVIEDGPRGYTVYDEMKGALKTFDNLDDAKEMAGIGYKLTDVGYQKEKSKVREINDLDLFLRIKKYDRLEKLTPFQISYDGMLVEEGHKRKLIEVDAKGELSYLTTELQLLRKEKRSANV